MFTSSWIRISVRYRAPVTQNCMDAFSIYCIWKEHSGSGTAIFINSKLHGCIYCIWKEHSGSGTAIFISTLTSISNEFVNLTKQVNGVVLSSTNDSLVVESAFLVDLSVLLRYTVVTSKPIRTTTSWTAWI